MGTREQTKIVGNYFPLLLIVKIGKLFVVAFGIPNGFGTAVMVSFGCALRVQSPRYVHRSVSVILPNVHHFVDKMRVGEGPPGVNAIKANVGQVIMAATNARCFVNTDLVVRNTIAEYWPGQRYFPW